MTIEDDIAFLERAPALKVLGHEALRILAIGSESRTIREGDRLFSEGDDADSAFVVQTGLFDLVSGTSSVPPVAAGPGALIGELALISPGTRPVTAVAREMSTVLRVTRQLFLKTLEGYPDAALRMRETILARLNRATSELGRVQARLTRP